LFEENQRHADSGAPVAWSQASQRATGLRLLKDNQLIDVHAGKELILSAGSIGSVQLLEASGVGSARILSALQIPVVLDQPAIGENLQDHLQIRTVYKIKGAKTVNSLYKNPLTRLRMGLEYALFRTGPLTMPPSTLGAFAKSQPTLTSPDLEWHVQPLSLPKFGEPLHPFDAITPSVCNLRPSSRGSVHIQHPETLASPKIQCNYLSTEDDINASVRGLEITRAIMRSHALARFEPQEFLPGPSVRTTEELAQAARELGTTIFHPVGTCAMGTVLDSDCRLRGIAGLRVVDASAMPLITSGNTNAPVMLIAQRAAESIVRDNSAL
ncbi:MAG: alcohol dehydrogenase, partial [Pseudomonadota bacterium]